jgi:hypothetical protein
MNKVIHKLKWYPKKVDGAREATACQFKDMLFAVRPNEFLWKKVTCKKCLGRKK